MAAATGSASASSRHRRRDVRISGTVARISWCTVIRNSGYSSRNCGCITTAAVAADTSGIAHSICWRSRRLLLIALIVDPP